MVDFRHPFWIKVTLLQFPHIEEKTDFEWRNWIFSPNIFQLLVNLFLKISSWCHRYWCLSWFSTCNSFRNFQFSSAVQYHRFHKLIDFIFVLRRRNRLGDFWFNGREQLVGCFQLRKVHSGLIMPSLSFQVSINHFCACFFPVYHI